MVEPASTVSMWSTLVPVMVGGAIGLVGGWLGPWLVERRKEAAEKKKKRAEKFEELVAALYEHTHWLEQVRATNVLGREIEEAVRPIARCSAIVAVYFSEFNEQMDEVDLASRDFEMWTLAAGQKRLQGAANFIDGHAEALRPYINKMRLFEMRLREFSKKELQ